MLTRQRVAILLSKRRNKVAAVVGANDAAFPRLSFCRAETASTDFVVDRHCHPAIGRNCRVGVAASNCVEGTFDLVRDHGRRHPTRGPDPQVGETRDALFAVEWSCDGVATLGDQRAQFRGGLRSFGLEELHRFDFARQPHQ